MTAAGPRREGLPGAVTAPMAAVDLTPGPWREGMPGAVTASMAAAALTAAIGRRSAEVCPLP